MNNKTAEKVFTGLFGITVTIYFLGLLLLSFFNHASADDYFALLHERQYGFLGFQHFIYFHWGGRYFSSLIAALFSYNSFLISHYYVHTILLLVFTGIAAYWLVSVINKYLINKSIIKRDRLIFCLLISVNLYAVYPECSTALYWFSSAVTYQTSVILLMMLGAVMIMFLQETNNKIKITAFSTLIFLVIAINGSNEVAAILSAVIMVVLLLTNKAKLKDKWAAIILLSIVYSISILVLILAPGNRERMTVLDGKNINILLSVVSAFYRVFVVYWTIFQSALFWVSASAIFLYAIHIRNKIFMLQHHKATLKTILLFLAVWSILILIVLLPILLLSNGSIPDRALNVLSAASMIVFFTIAFYMGICVKDKTARMVLENVQLNYAVATVLLLCIIANNSTKEIAASGMSANTYHHAMKARENILINAKQLNLDSISLPKTDAAMKLILQNGNAENQKAILKQWMQRKPSLLFISDDIETPESRKILAQYYGIKLITAKQD